MLVNLIPYNPTYAPGSEEFKEPTEEALQKFKAIVYDYGLLVTIRRWDRATTSRSRSATRTDVEPIHAYARVQPR